MHEALESPTECGMAGVQKNASHLNIQLASNSRNRSYTVNILINSDKMQEIIQKNTILPFFPKGLMAEKNELSFEEEEYEKNPGYTPPAPKTLKEIQEQDKDDKSLLKYKQMLLGGPLGTEGVYARHPVGEALEKCVSASTHSFLPASDQTHTRQHICLSQQQSRVILGAYTVSLE